MFRLKEALYNNGLIDHKDTYQIVPHKLSFPREQDSQRQHFQIRVRDRPLCHLIVGVQLQHEFEIVQHFHRDCPNLACKPLFCVELPDGQSGLCLEHFDGTSLDTLCQQGQCEPEQWLGLVRRARGYLAETTQGSNTSALSQEIESLITTFVTHAEASPADEAILRDMALPALVASLAKNELITIWSNGDFVGRNLLVNKEGDIRLIDYEYLGRTHFSAADWLRLRQFSLQPSNLGLEATPEYIQADRHGMRVYLWLHHCRQLLKAKRSPLFDRQCVEAVEHLIAALDVQTSRHVPSSRHSYFLHHLAEGARQRDALLAERTAWGKSLECDIRKARDDYAALQAQFEARTAWTQLEARTALVQKLDHELASDNRATRQFWSNMAKSFEARGLPSEPLAVPDDRNPSSILEWVFFVISRLHMAIATSEREARAAKAQCSIAKLQTDAIESQLIRKSEALVTAQAYIDRLLLQVQSLESDKDIREKSLGKLQEALSHHENALKECSLALAETRRELSRYKSSAI